MKMSFTCKFTFMQIESFSFKKGAQTCLETCVTNSKTETHLPFLTLIVLILSEEIFLSGVHPNSLLRERVVNYKAYECLMPNFRDQTSQWLIVMPSVKN